MKEMQNKKHSIFSSLMVLCCILILFCISGCHPSDLIRSTATGRYIRGRSGAHLILIEEGYSGTAVCTMGNQTGDETIFDDLQTGDRIRITCDNFRETYPLQTTVFSCKKLESGNINDIPQEHIEYLTERGWMDGPVVKELNAEIGGKHVHIQLNLFPLWHAEEISMVHQEDPRCGLRLQSVNDYDVEVEILYYSRSFAMCGTGVDFKDITMRNGQPATLATEKRHDGGINVTLIMGDITKDDSFVAHYNLTKDQKKQYADEILDMLLGVEFQAE